MKKLIFVLFAFVLMNGCSVKVDWGNEDEKVEEKKSEETVNLDEEDSEENIEKVARQKEDEDVKEELITDTDLIGSYYSKLAEGDLQGAFDLKKPGKTSYKQFEGWYKNVLGAEISGFEELAEHKYRFQVDLFEIEDRESKYTVTMVIEDGLLNTLSSVKTWDNFSAEAYTVVANGETKLFVRKDGKEMLVKRFTSSSSDEVKVQSLRYKQIFYERYLVYILNGYEWHVLYVFDADLDKEVLAYGNGTEKYGFSKNGSYFYVCGGTGMLGGGVNIYKVPKFDLYRDLRQNTMVHTCYGYDQATNSLRYSLAPGGFDNEEMHTYYFDTGVVE